MYVSALFEQVVSADHLNTSADCKSLQQPTFLILKVLRKNSLLEFLGDVVLLQHTHTVHTSRKAKYENRGPSPSDSHE